VAIFDVIASCDPITAATQGKGPTPQVLDKNGARLGRGAPAVHL
jgi:hypothetical protein